MTILFSKRRLGGRRLAGRHPFVAVLTVAAMTLTSASAFAAPPPGHDDHGGDHGGDRGHQGQNDHRPPPPPQAQHGQKERPEFSHSESRYVRDYYRDHKWDGKPLPHGGHYTVGHRVPSSYRHPLPPDLRGHFPARPGYEPYIVGDDVVLIAVATGVIVDILSRVH
ncbi:MAG: RcnB family protein [Parvibaculum sp.]|uniref:hypothetical protein n=1 Tax=Parvibaculum sp. TaxID=2024848 RepID=UPI0025EEC77D|nr:hypothetical protein [Parvibaculum sp.]MCE9648533.1 RcnB family protein [Parvibaculum sp.]